MSDSGTTICWCVCVCGGGGQLSQDALPTSTLLQDEGLLYYIRPCAPKLSIHCWAEAPSMGGDHSDKAELALIIKSAAGAEKEVWELVPHEHHHGHCVVLNCHV